MFFSCLWCLFIYFFCSNHPSETNLICCWQDSDSGMYTCVASSSTGESSWSGMLTVRGTFTLSLSHSSHSNTLVRAHRIVLTRHNPPQFNCLFVCFWYRGWIFFRVQSFWVHPASRTSAETCSDRGDEKHGDPHLAVQSPRGRRRRHLLRHRGLQVSF